MAEPEPIRIFVLGAKRAPLRQAAEEALSNFSGVKVVGASHEPISPAQVRNASTDLLLAAGYHHFVGPRTRAAASVGALGLHPSLLPAYRGSHPLWWALREGEKVVGLTLFRLVDEIDAGPILSQVRVETERSDSFGTLYGRVAARVPELLEGLIDDLRHGSDLTGIPQDESLSTVYRAPSLFSRAVMKAAWAVRRSGGDPPSHRPR